MAVYFCNWYNSKQRKTKEVQNMATMKKNKQKNIILDSDFGLCCSQIGDTNGGAERRCNKPATHVKLWLLDLKSGDRWFLIPCCEEHR